MSDKLVNNDKPHPRGVMVLMFKVMMGNGMVGFTILDIGQVFINTDCKC